jgi:hypothetical protein
MLFDSRQRPHLDRLWSPTSPLALPPKLYRRPGREANLTPMNCRGRKVEIWRSQQPTLCSVQGRIIAMYRSALGVEGIHPCLTQIPCRRLPTIPEENSEEPRSGCKTETPECKFEAVPPGRAWPADRREQHWYCSPTCAHSRTSNWILSYAGAPEVFRKVYSWSGFHAAKKYGTSW